MKSIKIIGARQHNLKNVDLELPRDKFIVITGLSGSGKSTLAFDTLYAEGQRRYVESLSSYARQFLGMMQKPDVDRIEGLSPAISIEQKTTSKNPRSTVGTVTEIYDYLRLLFARIGKPHCPEHGIEIKGQTAQRIVDRIFAEHKNGQLTLFAPLVRDKKGTYEALIKDLHANGYTRVRVNGVIYRTDEKIPLERYKKHTIEVVIDRLGMEDRNRLSEAVENGLKKGDGVIIIEKDGKEKEYSSLYTCPKCDFSFPEIQPRLFSFNSPFGACGDCQGLGVRMDFDPDLVIPDRSKSVMDGAIALYGKIDLSWRGQQLQVVGKAHGFDLFTPISEFSKKQLDVLLYGSTKKLKGRWSTGAAMNLRDGWEGVIPQSERLYKQTNSDYRRRQFEKFMGNSACHTCRGRRLQDSILSITLNDKSIIDVTDFSIKDCRAFFKKLSLDATQKKIAHQVLKEISERLRFLDEVGLGYLTLSRAAGTLSGGEAQRIRLATQIGSQLMGVMYILDEPSIGLHQRDNKKLIDTLLHLRDLGNTLIVVEHDEETIRAADHVVDVGPGAGIHGGAIVSSGTPTEVGTDGKSLTGKYLSGDYAIGVPEKRRELGEQVIIRGCSEHNLKNVDLAIPTGVLTCLTGVSGSGKSTFMNKILYPHLMKHLHNSTIRVGKSNGIEINGDVDKVIVIDQSPIGRTPRSNPATYTKLFDEIRMLFALTPEARLRGYSPGRFSFNVRGGRCEACQGDGQKKIEMHFLPDIYVDCEECKGKRFNRETLEVLYKGKSIADVLDMSVEEAMDLFNRVPGISRKLETLQQVGLSYIKLGQSSTTLSGGEAQRIKLTRELAKRGTGKTMYLLDEPTTGLHFHDVKKLISVLQALVDKGNSIVVIEHNLDVVKCADWILDLGPEGGEGGGQVVAEGTPEEVARVKGSYTGRFLKPLLARKK